MQKPLKPRNYHWSHVTRLVRRSASIVEIHRWYAAPRWGVVVRVYRLTPASAGRLDQLSLHLARLLGAT